LRYDFISRKEKKERKSKIGTKDDEKYDYPDFIQVPTLKHPDALALAIKWNFYAQGAERAAYFMTEVDKQSKPVGELLIAKVSINHEDGDSLKFH
jgi:hypothetical protein